MYSPTVPTGQVTCPPSLCDEDVKNRQILQILCSRQRGRSGRKTAATLFHVEDLLVSVPGLTLLALTVDGDHVGVAIGVGDVLTADCVAVIVPGLGATLTDVEAQIAAAVELNRAAVSQRSFSHPETVATVVWCDYRRPLLRFSARRATSVASYRPAVVAAARLNTFLAALPTSACLTVVGHSYGSLVATHAVRSAPGQGHRLPDRLVLAGSPGVGVAHHDDFGLPPGNVFSLEASGDVVASLNWFGAGPSALVGVRRLSAQACAKLGTLPTPGHAHYFEPNTTAVWNLAAIVSGNFDNLVDHQPLALKKFSTFLVRPVKAAVRKLSVRYHSADAMLGVHTARGAFHVHLFDRTST